MDRRTALMLGLAVAAMPSMPSIDYEGVVTGPRPKHAAYAALPTGGRVAPRVNQAKRRKRARR